MPQRLIIFDDDYPPLSLSQFTSPVQTVTRTVLDIRVVQGLVGILTDREPVLGVLSDEQAVMGVLSDEQPISAQTVERDVITGELSSRDSIIGVLED